MGSTGVGEGCRQAPLAMRWLMGNVPGLEGLKVNEQPAVLVHQRSGLPLLTSYITGTIVDLQLVNQFGNERPI